MRVTRWVVMMLIFGLMMTVFLIAERPDIQEVLDSIDKLYRSDSSYAEFRMIIQNPHWERTLRMKSWSEGKDKTFIRILEPKKERGIGTLRLDNEMWNYLPKTNKVIKIPPSMMMSSWMGSDFKNDDLVKEFNFLEDYTYEYVDGDDPDRLTIRATPREGRPIIWGYVIMQVRRSDYIPVRDEFFDENGELMRVMTYRDIKSFDGKRIPSVMELVPQHKEGHKTVIIYEKARFHIDLDEDIFTLRNLRERI